MYHRPEKQDWDIFWQRLKDYKRQNNCVEYPISEILSQDIIVLDRLVIDEPKREVYVNKKLVPLTDLEFDILIILVLAIPDYVTCDTLLERLQHRGLNDLNCKIIVSNLCKKFRVTALPHPIQVVGVMGYRIDKNLARLTA